MLTSHASFCYDTSSSIWVEQTASVELTKSQIMVIMPTEVVAVGQKEGGGVDSTRVCEEVYRNELYLDT